MSRSRSLLAAGLFPASAAVAEDFAVAFDLAGRGPLVGEATGGSTGQPLMFALPGGGQARVCTKRDTYPDGREFVGVGVIPDRKVPTTVADLRAGRDRALEAAIEEVRGGAGGAWLRSAVGGFVPGPR